MKHIFSIRNFTDHARCCHFDRSALGDYSVRAGLCVSPDSQRRPRERRIGQILPSRCRRCEPGFTQPQPHLKPLDTVATAPASSRLRDRACLAIRGTADPLAELRYRLISDALRMSQHTQPVNRREPQPYQSASADLRMSRHTHDDGSNARTEAPAGIRRLTHAETHTAHTPPHTTPSTPLRHPAPHPSTRLPPTTENPTSRHAV